MILSDLHREHPLRNTPLRTIQAECRNKQQKVWRSVEKWAIGKNTFNELGSAWTDTAEFRVNVPEVPPSNAQT